MAIAASDRRTVEVPGGTLEYREAGQGPVLVFVHAAFFNGELWRKVVPLLADRFRCVVPELPLGAHRLPMGDGADLSPEGLAAMVAAFLEALDLSEVTLVGTDTGGGICQMVAVYHPERLARLVLAPCDAYEHYPPPKFAWLVWVARRSWGSWLVGQTMRWRWTWRTPLAYRWLIESPDAEAVRSWGEGLRGSPEVRRDLARVMRGTKRAAMLRASARLGEFAKPVLVVWSSHDKVFPMEDARRLVRDFPDARLEVVESKALISEDRPEELAGILARFVEETA